MFEIDPVLIYSSQDSSIIVPELHWDLLDLLVHQGPYDGSAMQVGEMRLYSKDSRQRENCPELYKYEIEIYILMNLQ